MRKRTSDHNFRYFMAEGLSNMFAHGFMSFAAIGITVACLLIMGTFSLVAVNADATLQKLEEENDVLAFVDDRLSVSEARALEDDLLALPNVTGAEFISREEALESYKAQFEDDSYFQNLGPETLRHRFLISMADLSLMEETKAALLTVSGIADVNGYEEVSNGFIAMRNVATVVCVALIAVLFLVSVFIVANTIRLTTFDRRNEIAIMKIVGATNGFIRWPFVYEGFLMGLVAAAVAFFLQWGLYRVITGGITQSDVFSIVAIVPFSSIWLPVALVFVFAGMLIGIGGSLSAIRQFLKV